MAKKFWGHIPVAHTHAEVCAEKTHRGGVYQNEVAAALEAKRVRARSKGAKRVTHYRCPHCNLWHIGNAPIRPLRD